MFCLNVDKQANPAVKQGKDVALTTFRNANFSSDYMNISFHQIIDNQRNGLETHAKVDATSVIRFVWNPVTSL
jgi:hypothetical protein